MIDPGSRPAPGDLLLVQAFVNTLDVENDADTLATPSALTAWLAAAGLGPASAAADAADLATAVVLRETLRAALRRHHEPVGDVLTPDGPPLRLGFDGDGRPLVLGEGGHAGAGLARLLGIVVAAAALGTFQRLKVCPEQRCQWAFYDASRNRSGTWCSMAVCGSRVKMRAYRARHTQTSAQQRSGRV